MAVVWQNASYNQPPHLSYSLAESLGIDRATYKTNVTSNAPEADPVVPVTSGTEVLNAPSSDRGTVKGTSYTAGEYEELTDSKSGDYLKIRTGQNENTITFSVNQGYAITAISIEGYSNNKSTLADRSIIMTGIFIDDAATSVLAAPVVFPGGTAGQSAVQSSTSGFRALKKIVLVFDNSNIVTGEEDPAGKNKQLFAKITFTYEQDATGIKNVETMLMDTKGNLYNLSGQRVGENYHGIVIKNGRKYVK